MNRAHYNVTAHPIEQRIMARVRKKPVQAAGPLWQDGARFDGRRSY